jgi:hypothetical protein
MEKPISDQQALSGSKWLLYILPAILALFMINGPFVNYMMLVDKGETWLGLDPSARATLNYAWIHHLNWGKDIIYTYGPLSFISTRVGWGLSRWVFVLTDVFTAVNFFFLFRDFLAKAHSKFLAGAILVILTALMVTFYGSGLAWIFTTFIFYWIYKSYNDARMIYFIPLILLIVLSFYIKLNTGLFAMIFFVMHVCLLVIMKRMKIVRAVLLLAALIVVTLFAAWLMNVSIPAYIQGAFEVMKGFNSLMYLTTIDEQMQSNVYLVFYCLLLLILVYVVHIIRTKQYALLFFAMLNIAYIFLLKKQSLLRADTQHMYEFFFFVPFVLLYGSSLVPDKKFQQIFLGFTLVIVCLSYSCGNNFRPLFSAVTARTGVLKEWKNGFRDYTQSHYINQQDKRYLPPAVLAKIGNHSIDVFPWDSEFLIQNKLNYTPRPCFQTFQANTEYLQNANYNFFLHKTPEFVLYDYDALDGCNPFNDAPQLNYFLLNNYTVTDTFYANDRFRLLLQKKPQVSPVTLIKIAEVEANMNEEIPTKGAAFMKIYVDYTTKGKLDAYWDKPSPIRMGSCTANDQWYEDKISQELLKAGIMSEKRINDTRDFMTFAIDKNLLQPVIKIKLLADEQYVSKKIKVEYYKLN